ncbi:MAG: glutaminyl-peptide cyclotransferase [Microthrixaceae bacterium]
MNAVAAEAPPEPAARRRTRAWAAAALVLALLAVAAAAAWWWRAQGPIVAEGELDVKVERTLPHDPAAFTQGLEVIDGEVVESAGQYGASSARRWDLDTGTVSDEVAVPEEFFAEGLTALPGGRLVQLTWKEGTALVRDVQTLEEVDRFSYEGEGWGLCLDEQGERLVMSDGSAQLTFRDPSTFAEVGSVEVTDANGAPVERLNELECEDGRVWANVWQTDTIVVIDPDSGDLRATVDASGLLSEAERADADVLNGIAALGDGRYLLTGKLWPKAFVVRFVPRTEP